MKPFIHFLRRLVSAALILFLFPLRGSAQEIWEWQNPHPTGSLLSGIQLLSPAVAVAAGNNASLMITSDSGKNWRLVPFAEYDVFSSLAFLNDRKGLLGGTYGNLYRTEDGGASWSMINTGETQAAFQDIHILDERNAAVVGGTIIPTYVALRSTDGGATWVKGNTPSLGIMLRGVRFLDSLHGWAVGDGGHILRTTDAGWNWSVQLTSEAGWGNVRLNGIVFVDAQIGVIVGDKGTVLRTTDAGETWAKLESGTTSDLFALHAIDESSIVIVGDRTALTSTDAGVTWKKSGLGGRLYRVASLPGSKRVMAVGEGGGIVASNDGGMTWESLYRSAVAVQLQDVAFADADHGVVVGNFGETAFTTDGGATWRKVSTGTSDQLLKVDYPVPGSVFALSKQQSLFISSNGGAGWTKRTGLSARQLLGLSFAGVRHGMIVGVGTILTTTDGGASWKEDLTSATQVLHAVSMADSLYAMAAGIGGAIYRTTDGGASWTALPSGFTADFTEVEMTDRENAFVKAGETLIRTTDGGTSWRAIAPPAGAIFNRMSFVDAQSGWIAGENGVAYATKDGGATWRTLRHNIGQTKSGSSALRSICFVDKNHGWFAGNDGCIIRYSFEESTGIEEEKIRNSPLLSLVVQPNPALESASIHVLNLPGEEFRLQLCDMLGKRVFSRQFQHTEHYIFSVETLPEGVYYVEVRNEKEERVGNVLVVRR